MVGCLYFQLQPIRVISSSGLGGTPGKVTVLKNISGALKPNVIQAESNQITTTTISGTKVQIAKPGGSILTGSVLL